MTPETITPEMLADATMQVQSYITLSTAVLLIWLSDEKAVAPKIWGALFLIIGVVMFATSS